MVHGLGCSAACGIFPDQGSNWCPLVPCIARWILNQWTTREAPMLNVLNGQVISNKLLLRLLLFSHLGMSNSLRAHGLQHTRLPCSSPSPGVCSDLCPLSPGCHPMISSSDEITFSSCRQTFPETESFPMSWLFASSGRSIVVSGSAPVLPMNIQG